MDSPRDRACLVLPTWRKEGEEGVVSCVQFSAALYFGDESEDVVTVDVQRMGFLDTRVFVRYATRDASAKAGTTYEAKEGWVVFEPGEYMKAVSVPLNTADLWTATCEFEMFLSEPENCTLGHYLHTCRIKVLSAETFPSSTLQEDVVTGEVEQIPGFVLFLSFCRWNALSADLVGQTLLTLVCDQLLNFYKLGMTYLIMYLINVVCIVNPDNDDELLVSSSHPHRDTAFLIAFLHVAPWALLLVWDWAKVHMDLHGRSTRNLQLQLYRKFMNMEAANGHRAQYGILAEAPQVSKGYVAAIEVVRRLIDLGLNMYLVSFQLPAALPLVGLEIVVIFLWSAFRQMQDVPTDKKEHMAVSKLARETSDKHSLICEYMCRPAMNDKFEHLSEDLRSKRESARMYHITTDCPMRLVAPLFVFSIMITNVGQVLDGDLPLGSFLAVIKIANQVAKETIATYFVCEEIGLSLPALRSLTVFLNEPTEMTRSKDANRLRRALSKKLFEGTLDGDVNTLPILVKGLGSFTVDRELLVNVSFYVEQGQLVAIVGPESSGKNLMLQILANRKEPSAGVVFVPAHLRVLLVSQNPVFLDRSLLANLTIGVRHFDADVEMPRLRRILEDLELGSFIPVIDEDLKTGLITGGHDNWSKGLATVDAIRLGIARALLMNPEVLLLQKPFAEFSDSGKKTLRGLLKRHRDNRGLELPPEEKLTRRPRTVVYCSDTLADCKGAEVLFEMIEVYPGMAVKSWTMQGKNVTSLSEKLHKQMEAIEGYGHHGETRSCLDFTPSKPTDQGQQAE